MLLWGGRSLATDCLLCRGRSAALAREKSFAVGLNYETHRVESRSLSNSSVAVLQLYEAKQQTAIYAYRYLPVGTDMRILPSAALPRTAVTLQLSCCSTSAIRRDAFRSSNLRQSSSLEQERPISLDTASSQSPSYAPPKGANKSTY